MCCARGAMLVRDDTACTAGRRCLNLRLALCLMSCCRASFDGHNMCDGVGEYRVSVPTFLTVRIAQGLTLSCCHTEC